MSDLRLMAGFAIEDEDSRRLKDAWHRAERGGAFRERPLAFESWEALARVLTRKAIELLHYVRRHDVASIRASAKPLYLDYSSGDADVQAPAGAERPDASARGVRAD